ncbi:Protein PROCA1 [Sciurus carolinensis]|uniref:Protein PROCA1 n=1 Tax=Sciurus carolinensis TaxID=30640 RepID=A0AA41MK58_SCICA|nr:protein PROCA1-like [Sciurus carolinensis]MBZ3873207.1 Protein PROCA1 [Sciurus carolinensis]
MEGSTKLRFKVGLRKEESRGRTGLRAMRVRTTLTIERWTEEETGPKTHIWDKSESSGECKETDSYCWKHKQCAGHIIHPFSDYGHHNLHVHAVSHCDCDTRCKSYRPVSMAVIHHPIHHECGADDLNEEEEEEEESRPLIPTQVGPTTKPTEPGTVTGTPDSAAPITIWHSESPTRKSPDIKVSKKIKKKKEKDKEEEMSDEKTKLKKKTKKGKLTKKKSPMKSESSPPDLCPSLSPRVLTRMSESSPESPEDLESSEVSYSDRGQQEPSSEDIVESSSSRKREKCIAQIKKNRAKTSPTRKVTKRKSPPVSNPNLC